MSRTVGFYTDNKGRQRPVSARSYGRYQHRSSAGKITVSKETYAKIMNRPLDRGRVVVGFFHDKEDDKVHPIAARKENIKIRSYKRRDYIRTDNKISAQTNELYAGWNRQYKEDKKNGQKRKALSKPALEKYVRARKLNYLAQYGDSGDATGFNDKIDHIDSSVASDSWADLDGEFEKVYGIKIENIQDQEADIREEINKDRQIEKEYREYIEDLRKNDPEQYQKYLESQR